MKEILSQKRQSRLPTTKSEETLKPLQSETAISNNQSSADAAALKSLVESVKRKTNMQQQKGKRAKLNSF